MPDRKLKLTENLKNKIAIYSKIIYQFQNKWLYLIIIYLFNIYMVAP